MAKFCIHTCHSVTHCTFCIFLFLNLTVHVMIKIDDRQKEAFPWLNIVFERFYVNYIFLQTGNDEAFTLFSERHWFMIPIVGENFEGKTQFLVYGTRRSKITLSVETVEIFFRNHAIPAFPISVQSMEYLYINYIESEWKVLPPFPQNY